MLRSMPSTRMLEFAGKTFSRCSAKAITELSRAVFADGSSLVNRAVCGSCPPCAHDECTHAWCLHATRRGGALLLMQENQKTQAETKGKRKAHGLLVGKQWDMIWMNCLQNLSCLDRSCSTALHHRLHFFQCFVHTRWDLAAATLGYFAPCLWVLLQGPLLRWVLRAQALLSRSLQVMHCYK